MKPLEKAQFISNWIKDYVEKMPSKAQSLIIGISGGIDSSVSSTLSAMTGIKTIVLSMPIKQKSSQHDLSLKHQEWLIKNFDNVEAHTLNLDKLFETFESTLFNFDSELGILKEIIEAAPTDGLWDDGRTDEGQLGLKDEELEEAMNNVNSINREKYEKIRKMNLHKMEPIPVCKIPN